MKNSKVRERYLLENHGKFNGTYTKRPFYIKGYHVMDAGHSYIIASEEDISKFFIRKD